MVVADDPKLEEIRKLLLERGVEFIFAQFVDLYGRPSAKLVPAANLDDLVREGAGFAGFAAGEIGQVPSDPDIAAIPDLDSFTPRPVAAEPRSLRLRRHGRGRALAVLPAHDPAPSGWRGRRSSASSFKIGIELEYFLVRRTRRRLDRDRRRDRHAREALLRHGRADAAVRLPDPRLEVLQRARLGQLRERPRGRERPVRAELRLRRRARQLRPGDLLPLHGAHARRAARHDRDLHAEAVHAADRQRLPLPHVALAGRRERLPRRSRRPAGLGLSETAYGFIGGLKAHARAYSALTAPTVNSYKRLKLGSTASGATWSPVWISYGYNNRTQMLRIPAPGRIEDRTIDGSATRTSPRRPCSPRGSTGSRTGSRPASRTGRTSTPRATTTLTMLGLDCLPGEPARGDRRARAGRRPARGARPRPRRGLRRLLRAREARRVVPLPRAGHRLGDQGVPDPVLTG